MSTADAETLFSPDYGSARERFRAAARSAGATLDALAIDTRGPRGESLFIDIARLGDMQARRVLVHSSGLHGVEAFAGAAVQLGALQDPPPLPAACALILVHALNPYGMAWLRRANENNVDLNRNFLTGAEHWEGAPMLYEKLDPLLNPRTPPAPDGFWARLALLALRHGVRAPRQAIAEGQYEYPRGLFYGGRQLENGPRLYLEWLQRSVPAPAYLFAIDLHTGLGRWGRDTLIAAAGGGVTPLRDLEVACRIRLIDPAADAAVYRIRGGMGEALPRVLPGVRVDFVLQEIGTRPAAIVLRALREENRAHYHAKGSFPHPAKLALREALSPSTPAWRQRAVEHGLSLLRTAAEWTFRNQ